MKKSELDETLLWQDDHILVVNKPAGLLSIPDGYDPDLPHLQSTFEPIFGRLWMVHRLDRDTSGVVLLARNEQAHREICLKFERQQVTKIYHALVVGSPDWDKRTAEQPLRTNGDRQHRTVIDYQRGKNANTKFSVLERFGRYTLIEAKPTTGRTHQIRVHLKAVGIPVVADGLYGEADSLLLSVIKVGYRFGKHRKERPLLDRLGLHARSLTLEHPISRKEMCFEAPYAKDIAVTIRQLRRYSKPSRG